METLPPIQELSLEEGRALLDRQARRYLNISGEEFVQQWHAGAFDDNPDSPEIMRLAMLLPLAR
jgi:hypothetical protein